MKVFKDFNLKEFNGYKISAICNTAYFPDSESDLISIYNSTNNTKKILIGNGNNIILSRDYYDEGFIILNNCFNKIIVNDQEIIAEAGATLQELSKVALDNELTGFEPFYDIPSSVGGGVFMNAGTKEGEIKDIITKVRYFDLTNMNFNEITKEKIDFEYRNSFFQKNKDKIITKAWFSLRKGTYTDIIRRMEEIKTRRWAKQPRDYPSCGSVFKRPPGMFVGPMLEELGLKGYSIGGAKVSEKHAGFIINYNNATGTDILKLIYLIQKKVFDKFNITLELEQRIV